VTHDELLDAIDAELTDLMLSRRSDPAKTIGHAMRISKLLRHVRTEHSREVAVAERGFEVRCFALDLPANGGDPTGL
jgi:hypothetical protein